VEVNCEHLDCQTPAAHLIKFDSRDEGNDFWVAACLEHVPTLILSHLHNGELVVTNITERLQR